MQGPLCGGGEGAHFYDAVVRGSAGGARVFLPFTLFFSSPSRPRTHSHTHPHATRHEGPHTSTRLDPLPTRSRGGGGARARTLPPATLFAPHARSLSLSIAHASLLSLLLTGHRQVGQAVPRRGRRPGRVAGRVQGPTVLPDGRAARAPEDHGERGKESERVFVFFCERAHPPGAREGRPPSSTLTSPSFPPPPLSSRSRAACSRTTPTGRPSASRKGPA